MKAEEAYKIALNAEPNTPPQSQYSAVMERIVKAAKRGFFEVTIRVKLSEKTKVMLSENGYMIKEDTVFTYDTFTVIYWGL